MDNPDIVLGTIIHNKVNLIFLICALAGAFILGRYIFKSTLKITSFSTSKLKATSIFLISAILLVFGMRGKIIHPIRIGDAFFCNDPILNQAGLNPVFTLLKSYANQVSLMNDQLALKYTQNYLHVDKPIKNQSPIARMVESKKDAIEPNVVLVLMEGMSAHFMNYFGNHDGLTPNLDTLCQKSLFFVQAFSAGIHTNNGVFSTLYGFPALKRIRPMGTIPLQKYNGLPHTMKQYGYTNLFFTTHSRSFDNLENFIPFNHFDKLFASDNFPQEKVVGPYGVPDDYLFSQVINKMDSIKSKLFITLLTTSNHDPYTLPGYAENKFDDLEKNAIHFADWSIGKFLADASKKPWYQNTIFIFVADHGRTVGHNPYDLPLSYNHIPILFYSPKFIKPEEKNNLMGQIDIFPTLMGLLGKTYRNNTMGLDVLSQPRDFIYFSADDKLGCINQDFLFIHRFGGNQSLYKYKTNDLSDYSSSQKDVFEKMKNYAFAQTQTAEWLILNSKVDK